MKTKIKHTNKTTPKWKKYRDGKEENGGYANKSVQFVADWKVGDLVFKRSNIVATPNGVLPNPQSYMVFAILDEKRSQEEWVHHLFDKEEVNQHGWFRMACLLSEYPVYRSNSKYKCIVMRPVGDLTLGDEFLLISDTMGEQKETWRVTPRKVQDSWMTDESMNDDKLREAALDEAIEFFRKQNKQMYDSFCDLASKLEHSIVETEVKDHHQLKSMVNKVEDFWNRVGSNQPDKEEHYLQTYLDLESGRFAVTSFSESAAYRFRNNQYQIKRQYLPILNIQDMPVIENADWDHPDFKAFLNNRAIQQRLGVKDYFGWIVTGNFDTGACAIGFGVECHEGWLEDIAYGREIRRCPQFVDDRYAVHFEYWISNNADSVAREISEENHMTVDEQFERAMIRIGGEMN